MKIAIAAASGNIGRRTAEKVVRAGAETILLSRRPEQFADLVAQGAIVKSISSDDAPGLIAATENVDALFWLTPPKLDVSSLSDWYTQTAMAGATAVRENGIDRVVNISSIGAGAKPNLGTVSFSGDVEAIFNQTGANILHLRPASKFLAADRCVFSVPMYYFSIASNFKAYIDRVVRVGHTFTEEDGQFKGLVNAKKVLFITSRGVNFGAGSPYEGWDAQEPALRYPFQIMGVTDIQCKI
jgi:NAD(P)-dependent dehydrogenase (short-subunit alcohol dehydrogenase family)